MQYCVLVVFPEVGGGGGGAMCRSGVGVFDYQFAFPRLYGWMEHCVFSPYCRNILLATSLSTFCRKCTAFHYGIT